MAASQFCSGSQVSMPLYVPLPSPHTLRPVDLRKADLQGSNFERTKHSGEWPGLPDRMTFCQCESCNEPQNLRKINAMLASHQANFIPSQPNVVTMIVSDNLLQGASGSAGPKISLLGLPDELLLKIYDHAVPKEYSEITAEEFVDPVFFALSCKRLLGLGGRILRTKDGMMDRYAYGSSDKQHLLCKITKCWPPKDKRVCRACWCFRAFGEASKAKWLGIAAEQTDTAEHTKRTKAWEQNWEVKNWFGAESDEACNFRSDDERLRCPGCVMKGYRITVSKDFVCDRDQNRWNKEWLRTQAEKDKKEEERQKEPKKREEANRKVAEMFAVADAKIREQPVARGLKRQGEPVVAGVKRQKSHHTLCDCGTCSEDFFGLIGCEDSDFDSGC